MYKALFVLITLAMISSCSYKTRFKRLVIKHPDLVRLVDVDTTIKGNVTELDTYITPGLKDNFKIPEKVHDTIILKDEYSFQKHGQDYSFQVYPDTIIRHDTVPFKVRVIIPGKTLIIDNTPGWIEWIGRNWTYLAFLSLSLTLIIRYFKKKSGG